MTSADGGRRPESAQLLLDLVQNPLDPGYRAAAERRGPDRDRRWYDRPLVVAGCLLIGFVAVLAYIHTNRGAPQAAKVHDRLVSRVRDAERSTDRLATRVDLLGQQLAALRDRELPQSGALAAELRAEQAAIGQNPTHGPGITVTLREPPTPTATPSPARGGTSPIDATNILTDRDVRSVVNELWHDGAEAIAVNGIRLSAVTAIRFAGEVVLVDFQPITSPYRIAAIGDADDVSTAFAQSSVASRYQTLTGVDHIGFSVAESDRLSLPAAGSGTPTYARAVAR
ncbi:DUF881 domain-containing protein [uncultured Jatrophihabitans sp.]|uniref:DUF881 domain-containing protein n=1 Tax=uncultured Jatrophihabitans sp. TaxID=1610747 RepID=UPI0035C999A3